MPNAINRGASQPLLTADTISDAQHVFLADLGIGREVFAPNPSTMRALRKRGLIATRFIGMRWWWIQPTKRGAEILNARTGGAK